MRRSSTNGMTGLLGASEPQGSNTLFLMTNVDQRFTWLGKCLRECWSKVLADRRPQVRTEESVVAFRLPCRLLMLLPVAIAALSTCTYADDNPADNVGSVRTVDFENDLIPVFTKNGCNAGACHGAAIGRGGFKLSLYGGNPKSDFEAIVRQVRGRRINLARPDASLVVLKPTEHVEHGGGTVFDMESESARLLIAWVRQGAKAESSRELTRVEVSPKKQVVRETGEPIALSAIAHYSDGRSEDVTKWTIFAAEDSSAVEMEVDSAVAKVRRRGRHIVVARFLDEVVPLELIVPLSDTPVRFAKESQSGFVDKAVLRSLETLGLPLSPIADDATFLRRATLDLTGRLPLKERAKAFEQNANRAGLIDELLASTEFNEYWSMQLAQLLRIRPQRDDASGANTYHKWLADQVRAGINYKDLARTLITSIGDTAEQGPPNFYRTTGNAREQAEFVSELFMGSRLRCANCHNHPLDKWTQDDYHGLAAIFAKVESGQVVKPKPHGEVIHPRTLEAATLRIPGEQFLEHDTANGRERLADWLTDSSNPYFAKAIVNRLWKRMMGRGLVEPVDDFRATNPATHPELLNQLAADFVAHDYSLRHTLKVIATSAAYARSANAVPQNKDDDRFYSHAIRRRLEPEVLADAISDVLGVAGQYGKNSPGTRAVALIDPKTPSRTLDVLGRCGREESCESSSGAVGGLPQKLHLLNGELLNARIAANGSRLRKLLAAGTTPMQIVDEFYFVALSRRPTKQETRHWKKQLSSIETPVAQRAFLEDFVWGLMTCDEFVTNH